MQLFSRTLAIERCSFLLLFCFCFCFFIIIPSFLALPVCIWVLCPAVCYCIAYTFMVSMGFYLMNGAIMKEDSASFLSACMSALNAIVDAIICHSDSHAPYRTFTAKTKWTECYRLTALKVITLFLFIAVEKYSWL